MQSQVSTVGVVGYPTQVILISVWFADMKSVIVLMEVDNDWPILDIFHRITIL